MADKPPETGTVTNQAKIMFLEILFNCKITRNKLTVKKNSPHTETTSNLRNSLIGHNPLKRQIQLCNASY